MKPKDRAELHKLATAAGIKKLEEEKPLLGLCTNCGGTRFRRTHVCEVELNIDKFGVVDEPTAHSEETYTYKCMSCPAVYDESELCELEKEAVKARAEEARA